jgi:hypothetical protein
VFPAPKCRVTTKDEHGQVQQDSSINNVWVTTMYAFHFIQGAFIVELIITIIYRKLALDIEGQKTMSSLMVTGIRRVHRSHDSFVTGLAVIVLHRKSVIREYLLASYTS